mgnify:CR=1 FL=1
MRDQIAFQYSKIGCVIDLPVLSRESFAVLQCVNIRAFIIFSVFLALCAVLCTCFLLMRLKFSVKPKIFGSFVVRICCEERFGGV